jgi:hypothetical protein
LAEPAGPDPVDLGSNPRSATEGEPDRRAGLAR